MPDETHKQRSPQCVFSLHATHMNKNNFIDIEGLGVPVLFNKLALTSTSILSAISYVEQTPKESGGLG